MILPMETSEYLCGKRVDKKMHLALTRVFNKHMKNQMDFKRTGSTIISSFGLGGCNVDEDVSDDEDEDAGSLFDQVGRYL